MTDILSSEAQSDPVTCCVYRDLYMYILCYRKIVEHEYSMGLLVLIGTVFNSKNYFELYPGNLYNS